MSPFISVQAFKACLFLEFERLEASTHSFQKILSRVPFALVFCNIPAYLPLSPKGVYLSLRVLTLVALFIQHNFVHQSLSKILDFPVSAKGLEVNTGNSV